MKKFWLTGIALAAGLSLSSAASAQVRIGIAGPSRVRRRRSARS